jgi:cell division protein FtsB
MNTEENNNKFKIIVGILTLLLIVLAVYTVTLYNDNKDTVTILQDQKSDIESELQELIANYDEVIQDNGIKDKDLLEARKRIEVLLNSVKDSKANIALIRRYKSEIGKLKDERTFLFKKADSLIAVNKLIVAERDNAFLELDETIKVIDSVTEENQEMADKIILGSIVRAIDLNGAGVIVKNSGKIVDTQRSKRADKIRACFALSSNAIAEKGDRMLYIQVINPKNNLLGEKEVLEFENGTLNYSASTKVFYENEELDVCSMVAANEEDLLEGVYTINVFDGSKLIATSKMTLK